MKIAGFDLRKKVLIVAEIGNNHEGSFSNARRLVEEAAKCGADAVKFQTLVAEKLVSSLDKARLAQLKSFELSPEEFEALAKLARKKGLLFLSTPFDLESARFLDGLVPAFKIASGDNNFFPLIRRVAETGKPILFSTGMTDIRAVRRTRAFILKVWKKNKIRQDMVILHCVSSYPTAPEEANLLAIRQIAKLGATPGYSDHTIGIDAAVLAVALGARVIEKHFTLRNDFSSFRDHALSADPALFAQMVQRIRAAETLLGSGVKKIQKSERENALKARRSIAAGRDLEGGAVIGLSDLTWVRPAVGLPPGQESLLVGKKLRKRLRGGEFISKEDVI